MARKTGSFRRILAGAAAVASVVGFVSACGESVPRRNAVLELPTAIGSSQAAEGEAPQLDAVVNEISRIYDLYAPPGGFTREELVRLLDHYKVPRSEIVLHVAYQLDGNHDGRLSLREVLEGFRTQLIPFRWIGHGESVPPAQIRAAIDATWPEAAEPARALVAERLARFDDPTLGGNGDGLLSRDETALPGLAMKLFTQTSFETPEGASPKDALNARVLRQLLELQVFGRFPGAASVRELNEPTLALERQAFGLDLVWAARRVREPIPRADAAELLSFELDVEPARADRLLRLHDLRFAGGNGDGLISATELSGAAAAIRHGLRVLRYLEREPTVAQPRAAFCLPPHASASAPGSGKCPGFYRHLYSAFPEHGRALTFDGAYESGGAVYWDRLPLFDGPEWSGNGNGRIDSTEFAVAFTVLRMLDQAFILVDLDKSGRLTRAEISAMFSNFGVTDAQAATLFMSIDVASLGGIEGFAALINGDDPAELKPIGFASRILVLLDGI